MRSPGMAMQNPVGGHQKSFQRAVNFNRIDGILRTGWDVPARGWRKWRDGCPVKVHRQKHDLSKYPGESVRNFFKHINHLMPFVLPKRYEVTQKIKEKHSTCFVKRIIICASTG